MLPAVLLLLLSQGKPTPAVPLVTAGLAGQPVAVLPLTMVLASRAIPGSQGPAARAAYLAAADSALADLLAVRGSEVSWLLPAELQSTVKRAGGLLPAPHRMGQAVMRSPNLKDTPDPLRTYLRQLVAVTGGGRFALIPAALYVNPAPADSLDADLAAVLVDGRTGKVLWRTLARGRGASFADALDAALSTILPSESSRPPAP